MHLTSRSIVTFALAFLALIATALAPAMARKGPKPEPCPPARYLLAGEPIVSNVTGAAMSGLEIGPQVALDDLCGAVAPKRRQANKKGVTQVFARWKQCDGLTGPVILQGKILPGCGRFQGTLKAKKLKKQRIDATLSTCGDDVVDAAGGEECDDGNTTPGDGCEPTCVETAAPPATTAPTTSTTLTPATTTTSTLRGGATTTSTLRGGATTTSTLRGATTTSTTSSTTTTTLPKTVLELSLIGNPDPVLPLGLVTYELTATNRGPAPAVQAEVRLSLPVGLHSCGTASDAGQLPTGCAVGRDVVWALGTIPVGTSRTVHLVLQVGNLTAGTGVDVRARLSDAAGSPQALAQTITVVQSAVPLMLALDEGADPVAAGDDLEYVLRFGNRGTNALLGAQLVLTLPPGATLVDRGGGTVASNTVTWGLGALNAAQTGERRVRVHVEDLGAADPLIRVAQAVLSSGATAARASAVTLRQPARLGLVMRATPDAADVGGLLTYELTVTNRGTEAAEQVDLRMTVPIGRYDCYGASDDGTGAGSYCVQGQDIVWALGTLAPATSRTVHAIVANNLTTGAIFSAHARVQDAAGTRARARVSTAVEKDPPLELALTTDADAVPVDGELEYVLRYGNRGNDALLATQLVLTLPPGTILVDPGGGTPDSDTVRWGLDALNAAQTGEQRVRVRVGDLGEADPLVRVARAVLSSGATAARATAVNLRQAQELGLVMRAAPDPDGIRGLLTYELTVTNRGTADAEQVTLRMTVPIGRYDCYGASDGGTGAGSYCAQGQDIVWALGPLARGTSRTVHAIVAPNLAKGEIFSVRARVEDAEGARARTAVSTAVEDDAPLELALTTDADTVAVDGELEYVLRYGNRGHDALLAGRLVLTLPPGTTLVDGGGGTPSGATVAWGLNPVDPAETGERRVRVRVEDLGVADPLIRVARAVVASGAVAARASAVTAVQAPGPLGLVITASPDPVTPPGLLTYELTVTNRSATDPAVQVDLRMTVPIGRYDCYGASDDGTGAGSYCVQGQDIVWALGTLAPGTSRTVHANIVPNVETGSVFSARARVEDAAGSRVRAAISTAVQAEAQAPLSLALTESVDPVPVGGDLDYVLRFGNRGTAALLGSQLVLTLPPGVTVLDAAGGTVAGGTIAWGLQGLDPAETGERRVRVRIADLGEAEPFIRVARALVSSGKATAQAGAVTLVQPTTLGLVMEATPDPIVQRGLLTYRLTVTNNDTDDPAVQVALRMFIPGGTYDCGATTEGGTFPGGCRQGGDVLWNLNTLAPRESRQVQVILRPNTLAPGSIYSTTARVQDAAGSRTRTGVSTVVIKP